MGSASGLWLPSSANRDHDTALQYTAEVRGMVQRFHGVMKHWTETYRRELNDDRLEIVFVPPYADPAAGVTPGRYHWIRYNDAPNPPTIEAIEDPETGAFCEPGHWHIELMRRADLQNPQILRAQREAQEKKRREKERQKERDTEERIEHLRDSYKARFNTSISMNRSTPWSQNAKGQRAARAYKKSVEKESK